MDARYPPELFFLVEWYQGGPATLLTRDAAAHLAHAATGGDTCADPVRLVMALNVPEDETLFVVFRAMSADAVIRTCQRAGWPPDRISTDVRPWPIRADP
jgi:hypothetical protein